MSSRQHRIAQLVLLEIWVLTIVTIVHSPVGSQTCDIPRYSHPQRTVNAWFPGSKVVVRLDEWFTWEERNGIEAGNKMWNNPVLVACSGVEFEHFGFIRITDYDASPPRGELIWQLDDPGTGFNAGVFMENGFGGRVESARIKVKPEVPNIAQGTYFNYLGTHEVGHTFNLNDCISTSGCPTWTDATIMTGHADGITSPASFNTGGPKACDVQKVAAIYCDLPTPTPTATPTPIAVPTPNNPDDCQNIGWFWNFTNNTCSSQPVNCAHHCVPYLPLDTGGCFDAADYCAFAYGCPPGTVDGGQGCCCFATPVVIDVAGNGFHLSDVSNGVQFDMGGDGHREPISWTIAGSDDAWLALDRNGNGVVDSAKELFGTFTDQPHATSKRNGFVALAEFDRVDNGGNSDGQIDNRDFIFKSLRLWQDVNHNGVSEISELSTLPKLGVSIIDLKFKDSRRVDSFGNQFLYRAKVTDAHRNQAGRWAYDVTLVAR